MLGISVWETIVRPERAVLREMAAAALVKYSSGIKNVGQKSTRLFCETKQTKEQMHLFVVDVHLEQYSRSQVHSQHRQKPIIRRYFNNTQFPSMCMNHQEQTKKETTKQ